MIETPPRCAGKCGALFDSGPWYCPNCARSVLKVAATSRPSAVPRYRVIGRSAEGRVPDTLVLDDAPLNEAVAAAETVEQYGTQVATIELIDWRKPVRRTG